MEPVVIGEYWLPKGPYVDPYTRRFVAIKYRIGETVYGFKRLIPDDSTDEMVRSALDDLIRDAGRAP